MKRRGNRHFYNMQYLLNIRERAAVNYACSLYWQKFRHDPYKQDNLFIHLGDNPWSRLCWSGSSGKIPTFRTGSGRIYNPKTRVWLTPKDKLAALGLPVTPGAALALGAPILPIADDLRAGSIAGNSFHFSSATVVQFVALSCYRMGNGY